MRGRLLAFALASAIAVACGSPTAAPTSVSPAPHTLTAAQAVEAFLTWVCPGSPVIANSSFKPVASPKDEPGAWQIATDGGIFTLREVPREVVPASDIAKGYADASRAGAICQPGPPSP